jgi:hypothetical protein
VSGGRIRARWCMSQQIWASWIGRIRPMSCFFVFSFLFYPFSLVLLNYIPIFLFLYINKASPRLTPYRLKGKKGVGRLRTPYLLKNYGGLLHRGSVSKEATSKDHCNH